MAVSKENIRIRVTIPRRIEAIMKAIADERGVSVSVVAAEVLIPHFEKTAVSSTQQTENKD